jgi:hypothetical protein
MMGSSDAEERPAKAPSPRGPKGFAITVRLFPQVHGALLHELARVPCGSRSARVIHLVTVGLMYERAYSGTLDQSTLPSSAPPRPAGEEAVAMRTDDLSFVSALLDDATA